jgi:hypothetical protein
MLGHAYYEGKKMDSAVSSFQNSITINEKNNYSTLLLGWATAALDYLLYEMGNYLESLNYAVQHLALSEKLNDTTGKGAAHLVFGHDYKYLGYYREALDHYFQARKFFKMDWEAKTGKEDNIYTFLCIAETYLKMKQLDSSFQFTQLAYKQAVEKADGGGILFATRLFGDISQSRGDDTAALEYYRQYIPGYVTYKESNRDLGFVLNGVARIFEKRGEMDSAIFYAEKALANAEVYSDQENLFQAANLLADFYKDKDYHAAYNFLKIATAAKDSMITSDKLKQAQILEYNEEVREKELAAIETKETARRRRIIITAAVLIAIASFLIIYRIRQLRLKYKTILEQKESEKLKTVYEKKLIELEAKALRAQINQHFIFNCINSIKSLIQKNENEKATEYLTTFSKLIRTIFQNSDKREITLFDEIETCRLYTQLESMRFGNKLSYSFYIDKTLDLKSVMVPALILQPFIENAIWHGIMPKAAEGMLQVNVSGKEHKIFCIVEDDGIGREISMKNKFTEAEITHQSKGVRLTQSRLELSNMLNERNASVEIIDKTNGANEPAGTKVILVFNED